MLKIILKEFTKDEENNYAEKGFDFELFAHYLEHADGKLSACS
jgi:hypothetical protein